MPESPLSLAVVGHTNTGKTSLMRTLTRDAGFGEVSGSPSTTRQVEGVALQVDGRRIVDLYDTPGLEDAGRLIEVLDQIGGERHDGPSRIESFLSSPQADQLFEQEARVLRQLLASAAALYIIDAREPVLGKYQDELAILTMCARPVLPVLNFTASSSARSEQWREALARVNLHAVAEFDTVVFSVEAETKLWQRLINLLDQRGDALQDLIAHRNQQALFQQAAAMRIVSELLIDVAGCERTADKDDAAAQQQASQALQRAVRSAEQDTIKQLLDLFHFTPSDVALLELPIQDGQLRGDLFDQQVLQYYALRVGRGAGAGAAAGAAVDVATGGLSLGAGTVIGTLLGTGIGTGLASGRNLVDKARGRIRLQIDDPTLTYLAGRQLRLIRALQQRGHASLTPEQLDNEESEPTSIWPKDRLPNAVFKARLKPAISRLNNETSLQNAARERLAAELAQVINPEQATNTNRQVDNGSSPRLA